MRKIYFTILSSAAILFFQCGAKEPTSCVTVDKSTALKGEVLTFTNCSEDYVTAQFDFGDGNTSTISNPTHIFDEVGIYEVKMTATNVDGSTSISTIPITINEYKLTEFEVENVTVNNQNTLVEAYVDLNPYLSFNKTDEQTNWANFKLAQPVSMAVDGHEFNLVLSDNGYTWYGERWKINPYNSLDENSLSVEFYDEVNVVRAKVKFEIGQ